MVQSKGGTATTLFSKEGVTQGGPLSMFGYGIGILPLIRPLKEEFPEVKQPWYAYYVGAGGSFTNLRRFFAWLQEIGLSYGYFPEPSKNILVVHEHNRATAKSAFAEFGFNIRTGYHYLGSFIGSTDNQTTWIEGKVTNWVSVIADLTFVTLSHPWSAYLGLQKSWQQEWQFIQRVVKGIGNDFGEIKKAIFDLFLPTLFLDKLKECHQHCSLSKLPVKFAGLALPDPVASSESNFEASTLMCSHLLAAFRGV
jgi:hypothetical protein